MKIRKWLKQCRCGERYYGNNADKSCPTCNVITDNQIRKCACGCGKEFEYKLKSNPGYERKYFNKACLVRARRRTKTGKAYMEEYNKRYKRAEQEWKCKFPLCGKVFMSAYKRSYCDEHSNPSGSQTVWKKKNPLKAKAHWSINSMYRDRGYSTTRKREACLVCGEVKTEAHHHNYEKPRDVTFLCKPHHVELHGWDTI